MTNNNKIASVFVKLQSLIGKSVAGIAPPKEVEDIVQETYVRACQAKKQDMNNMPQAFLFKIARNLALDYVRRAETRLSVSGSESLDEEAYRYLTPLTDETLDQVIMNEEFENLCEAVRNLPTQQRRTFVMKKVYGYSQREIAVQLEISEKTVERHIGLAMKKCIQYSKKQNSSLGVKKSPSTLADLTVVQEGRDS